MSITEFSEGVSSLSSSRPKRISFASSLSVSSISFDSIWSGGSKLKFGGITNGGFSTTLYSSITFLSTPALLLIVLQEDRKIKEMIVAKIPFSFYCFRFYKKTRY